MLPHSLPLPTFGVFDEELRLSEQTEPGRFEDGKLGRLVHVHGTLIFFASLVPPLPGADRAGHVGIEVLHRTQITSDTGNDRARSVLLAYPNSDVGYSWTYPAADLTVLISSGVTWICMSIGLPKVSSSSGRIAWPSIAYRTSATNGLHPGPV